ncbi:STAS domain-containing protein [Nocardioides ochotonae]|uniref:STAS domain-containing protein n=1 Tax=Nocardioides ochotonae TaxID=2685869 RepID=UPI0014092D67|nr:STAS domain-containing protein [Nocardioides ochotonae]
MDVSITLRRRPTHTLLRLRGEFDLASRPLLLHRLLEARSYGPRVWVDADDVKFIEASCLHQLDRFRRRLRADGGSLRVIRASAYYELICRLADYGEMLPSGVSPVLVTARGHGAMDGRLQRASRPRATARAGAGWARA